MREPWRERLWCPVRDAAREYGKTVLVATIIAMLVCHSITLRDGFSSPDGLNEGLHYFWNSGVLLSVGRWVVPFTTLITQGTVMPVVHLLCNALCITGATLLLVPLWRLRGKGWCALCAVSMGVAPATVGQFQQIHTAYVYGLALFWFVAAAYLILRAPSLPGLLAGALAFAVGMGCYQAYLGFAVAVILFTLMLRCLEPAPLPALGRQALWAFGMGALGMVFYAILLKLTMVLFDGVVSNRMADAALSPRTLLANLLPGSVQAYKDFGHYVLERRAGTWIPFSLLMVVAGVCCLAGVVRLVRGRHAQAAVLVVLGVLIPIAVNAANVVLGGSTNLSMSYPMQLVLPFTVALTLRLPAVRAGNILRAAGALLCAAICWVDVVMAFNTYYTMAYTYRYVDDLAEDLLATAYHSGEYTPGESRLLIAGLPDENLPQSLNRQYYLFGDNLSEPPYVFWQNWTGVLWGWENYLYEYHGIDIGLIQQEEYEAILDTPDYAAMPLYPADGCVKTIHDIVVIKYKENPPR